ncbi:MAG: DUF937 domain-containing protein [Gemmatimonadaceae bacterium]|nr:DUF937 domain-containing protein [Gemmatimonadaceae bacterium]
MGLFDGVLGDAVGGLMGGAGGANAQNMLGGLLGQLGGGKGAGNSAVLATVMALVQQQGGVSGLVAKFQSGGLSDVVASWVGTGANAPISASQVQDVLGKSAVTDVAAQLGVDPAQAGSSIASMLPELINQLTPNGKVEAGSSDLLSQGLSMLKGLQGK